MLINLPYPQKSKAWNFRFIGGLSLFILVLLLFSFKRSQGSRSNHPSAYMELTDATSGELSLLTYNIAGLPAIISSAETERSSSIERIGEQVSGFDIVNAQEDFNYNAEFYAMNTHPFRTESMGGVPFGDGLSTLSKYPILFTDRVAWKDCSGSDCLTPKGFSLSRIQLTKSVTLDVYNIHATAQNNSSAVAARKKNLQQIAAYIHEKSKDRAVLIMGDFNAHYAFSEDNVRDFQAELGLSDSWVVLRNEGKLPDHQANFVAAHALEVHNDCESIDKILFRNTDALIMHPEAYQVEQAMFSNEKGQPLSDHCAISLTMKWELLDSAEEIEGATP